MSPGPCSIAASSTRGSYAFPLRPRKILMTASGSHVRLRSSKSRATIATRHDAGVSSPAIPLGRPFPSHLSKAHSRASSTESPSPMRRASRRPTSQWARIERSAPLGSVSADPSARARVKGGCPSARWRSIQPISSDGAPMREGARPSYRVSSSSPLSAASADASLVHARNRSNDT